MVIRVQPIEGDLSRYRVLSSDPHDDHEDEDIVQTGRVPDRVIQTSMSFLHLPVFSCSLGRQYISMASSSFALAKTRSHLRRQLRHAPALRCSGWTSSRATFSAPCQGPRQRRISLADLSTVLGGPSLRQGHQPIRRAQTVSHASLIAATHRV